jgi:hypothetical protein
VVGVAAVAMHVATAWRSRLEPIRASARTSTPLTAALQGDGYGRTLAKDEPLPGVDPDHPDENTECIRLMEALGTTDLNFAYGLVKQIAHASAKGDKVDQKSVDFILSVVKGIKPRDQSESMLAAQMTAVHMAIMKAFPQLADAEFTQAQDSAERTVNRLMRTFVTLMDALKRHRGGSDQTMTVRHVAVAEGGQANVGNVTQDQRPAAGPAAPLAIADAKMIPMPIIRARDAA